VRRFLSRTPLVARLALLCLLSSLPAAAEPWSSVAEAGYFATPFIGSDQVEDPTHAETGFVSELISVEVGSDFEGDDSTGAVSAWASAAIGETAEDTHAVGFASVEHRVQRSFVAAETLQVQGLYQASGSGTTGWTIVVYLDGFGGEQIADGGGGGQATGPVDVEIPMLAGEDAYIEIRSWVNVSAYPLELESATSDLSYTVTPLPEPRGMIAAFVVLATLGWLRRV
jgi:hypothetical protein